MGFRTNVSMHPAVYWTPPLHGGALHVKHNRLKLELCMHR